MEKDNQWEQMTRAKTTSGADGSVFLFIDRKLMKNSGRHMAGRNEKEHEGMTTHEHTSTNMHTHRTRTRNNMQTAGDGRTDRHEVTLL